MIIEGVRVEGFRCFVRSTEVRGFSPSLNVLAAPNGSGKSTLFEAIRRALIDHHTVSGAEAERMRPWGRSLAPEVTVDFVHGAVRYRVKKRFLDDPTCELLRWEGDAFVAVDRGERADEKVRALLSRPTAPKGLAREAHWGLAQVLWAPQGMIELGPLGPELAARVRETLAAQVVGARGAEIERTVEERFRALFTPQTAKLKAGKRAPEVVRKEEELALARAAVERARERHERTALCQERVGALRAELEQATRARDLAASHRQQLEASLRAFDARERARIEAESRARAAESEARAARAALDAWRSSSEALARLERAADEASIAVAVCAAKLEPLRVEVERAVEHEAIADQAALRLSEAEARLQEHRAWVEAREALERCERELAQLTLAKEDWQEARATLSATRAPSEQEIAEARRAESARERAKATLDALGITVTLRPRRPLELRCDEGARALGEGQSASLRGHGVVRFTLADVADVHVEGPCGDRALGEARDALIAAERALSSIEARWGTAEPAALEALRAPWIEAAQRERECDARLRALGGAEALEGAARRAAQARARVVALSSGTIDAAVDEAHERSLRAAVDEARAACARAGSPRERARARREAERALASAEAELAVARERLAQRESEREAARAAMDALSSEGQREASLLTSLDRAMLALDGARAAAEKARVELEGRQALERALRDATAQHARCDAEAIALRDALRTEEGRLDELSRGASFTALARAEEEVARIEGDVARLRLEAEAVKLLRTLLVRCREESIARVSGDVERAAEAIVRRVTGTDEARVELDERFAPTRARLGAADATSLDALSGGEREQVHFAVRLALAEVLAREERPMLVLDDVMVATDSARLARVIEVLEEASERMQIIVLTCHPERYASARRATRIGL